MFSGSAVVVEPPCQTRPSGSSKRGGVVAAAVRRRILDRLPRLVGAVGEVAGVPVDARGVELGLERRLVEVVGARAVRPAAGDEHLTGGQERGAGVLAASDRRRNRSVATVGYPRRGVVDVDAEGGVGSALLQARTRAR